MFSAHQGMNPVVGDDSDEELAALQAEAEARRAEEAAAHAAARPAHVVVPELTEGKTHHLFISHADEDTDWASQLVKTLEEDKGLKCFWYKRDFKPGLTIASSIQNAMMSCMKSLFILTPDFMESNWCLSEIDWATGLSVGEGSCVMIPLLLKPCDLPAVFTNFLYIDVPQGQDYLHRIVRSFEPEDETQKMIVRHVEFVPQSGSGLSKRFEAQKDVDSWLLGSSWTFPELQPQDLQGIGTKLATNVLERALEKVNNSTHLQNFSLFKWSSQCIIFCLSLMALVVFLFILMGLLIVFHTYDFGYTYYLHIFLWPVLCGIPLLLYALKIMSYRRIQSAVSTLTLGHVKNTSTLLFYNQSAQIDVMFYNVHPCLDYLTEMLTKKKLELQPNADVEDIKEGARLDAEDAVMKYLELNLESFMKWSTAKDSLTKRHVTYLNKMCLCERINQNTGVY